MVKEKSVGAVVFRNENHLKSFLLLHYIAGHWGFPKGHVEQGETEKQTLRREVEEETSLVGLELVPGFRQPTKYFFRRGKDTVFKEVAFYLAESSQGSVRLSHEHQGFEWLPYEQAMKRLSFKNTRTVLEKAGQVLSQSTGNS